MRDRVTKACKRGAKKGQRGFVYFITADKNIQAVKTGAAIAVIGSGIRSVADALNIVLGNPVEIRNFATAIRGVESGGQIEAAGVR